MLQTDSLNPLSPDLSPDQLFELPIGFLDDLLSADGLERVAEAAARWLPLIFNAEWAGLFIHRNGWLEPVATDAPPLPLPGPRDGLAALAQPVILGASDGVGGQTVLAPVELADEHAGTLALGTARRFLASEFTRLSKVARWIEKQLARHRQVNTLQRLAETDPLTGAGNRRAYAAYASTLWQRRAGPGCALSLALLDLDHFKRINDLFGHDAGDAVLCSVADLLRGLHRSSDHLFRIGGEEFAVLLEGAGMAEVGAFAERVRRAVEAMEVAHGPHTLGCTCSIGLGSAEASDDSFQALASRADRALYRAKNQGRNRVVAADAPPAPIAMLEPPPQRLSVSPGQRA